MDLRMGTSLQERSEHKRQRIYGTHQNTALLGNSCNASEQRNYQTEGYTRDTSESLLRKELQLRSNEELIEMIMWLQTPENQRQMIPDRNKNTAPLRRSSRILEKRYKELTEGDIGMTNNAAQRKELELVTNKGLIEMIILLKRTCNKFATLPDEIVLAIFKHLPAEVLCKAAQVSKRWRRVSYDPSLWRKAYFEEQSTVKSGTLSNILARGCESLVFIVGCKIELPIFTDRKPRKSYKLKELFFTSSHNKLYNEFHTILNRCRELRCVATIDACVDDDTCRLIAKNPNILQVMFYTSCNEVTYAGYHAILTGCRSLQKFSAYKWEVEGFVLQMSSDEIRSLILELPPSIKKLTIFRDCFQLTNEHMELLVAKHPALTHLCFSACPSLTEKAIASLSSLAQLVDLDISQCFNIPYESLSALAACPRLRKLCASGVVTEARVDALRRLLPKCHITISITCYVTRH